MELISPKPLKFKYSTMVTTVTQNAEDYEPIKIEQTQGPQRWQAVEITPDGIDEIITRLEAGENEGVVTTVGDITYRIKFTANKTGISLIYWATDNEGSQVIGETMTVSLKRQDFERIQDWMVRYNETVPEMSDPIEEAFQADVLNILGYNK